VSSAEPKSTAYDFLEDLRACSAAARDERQRIRRGLHDGLSQVVTALLFSLSWLERSRKLYPALEERIAELSGIAGTLKKEVAQLVKSLHPSELEEWGLVAILSPKIEAWAGVHKFQLHSSGLGGTALDWRAEVPLYCLVRAALLRSMHGPRTERIDLALLRRADHVLAIVEDDGGDPGEGQTQALRQLAQELGVEAEIDASPAGGTIVSFRIPL
jgi:signal transduction histidine kinase